MHTYARPRRGYCASCDAVITDAPVYRMDESYCCLGCAEGGPCICLYEADLASDGVDHLGLAFPMGDAATAAPAELAKRELSVR